MDNDKTLLQHIHEPHKWKDLAHPDELRNLAERLQKRLSGEYVPTQDETAIIRKNGKRVPVGATDARTVWQGQSADLVVARDITNRKQIEEALRKSEVKYRTLFNDIADPVFIFDQETHRFLDCNQTAIRRYGYTLDELRTMTPVQLHPPDEVEIVEKNIRDKDDFSPHYYTHITKDGESLHVEIHTDEVEYEGRKVWISIVRDITERKRAEEALRESEERYRNLVETSQDLIFRCDLEGRFTYLNKAWEHTHGYTVEEMLGRKFTEFQTPEVAERDIKEFARELEGGVTSGYETTHISKSGEVIHLRFNAMLLHDKDGRIIGTQGTAYDITEQKRTEEELEQYHHYLEKLVEERTAELSRANVELTRSARLKDEFLAMMSHELRTPLNVVLGMSEALQEKIYGPLHDRQLKPLRMIEESGRRLLKIITDILDLSAISTGDITLDIAPVDAESLCQASLRLITQLAQKKSLKMSFMFDSTATIIHADGRRLKQVLVNLLRNAVKFTPEGGKIGLEVEGDADHQVVRFTVWDTGIGITEEDMERLFQPFVQLDSRLSRKYEGTGLGLSLVYRLVELHGGSISVESEVGKGSRFTVLLPWKEIKIGHPERS